jgi:GNAT superfamily N-acetyltransferase
VELRPTTVGDLPAVHALFLASIASVYLPHRFEPPAPPLEVFADQQRHIIDSGGCSLVAIDGDSLMGFASAWSRGDDWFLASLFVAPAAQQGGIGQALLDAVWGDGHARRRTITDAIQPVSNALYARRGLVPATPVLSFSGTPCTGKPWAGAAPLTGSWHLADPPGETAPLDAVAYGFDRAVDHAFWSGLARRTIWARDATVVAYSYAFPRGHIGPVAGLDAEAAAGALEGELAQATGPVVVRIPGSSRSLVQVALRRGLRLSPTPGLLLLSAGAEPPTSLALSGFTLY